MDCSSPSPLVVLDNDTVPCPVSLSLLGEKDKKLKLLVASTCSFTLSNGTHIGIGLAPLDQMTATVFKNHSDRTLVISILSKPILFYKNYPYILEDEYLAGILSQETLASMERKLVSLANANNKKVDEFVPLCDAFPLFAQISFPTGMDFDSDPPIEFLNKLALIFNKYNSKVDEFIFVGDPNSPGPLSVALVASAILTSKTTEENFAKNKLENNAEIKDIAAPVTVSSFVFDPTLTTVPADSFQFERISIIIGSIADGAKAKSTVDSLFEQVRFGEGRATLYFRTDSECQFANGEAIRTPVHRILHHHAMGNLDSAATWLGRYAALILFAHWKMQKYVNDQFLTWISTTMPDIIFGQLQAFARRPASWWLLRPLPEPHKVDRYALKGTPNAAGRIKGGLPLILHSSALIMTLDLESNFQMTTNVPNLKIFSIGQMCVDMQSQFIQANFTTDDQILWLNLRGEPYIHVGGGTTWSLRDEATARRHLRAFVGVPSHRLLEIEERLASDLRTIISATPKENLYFFERPLDSSEFTPTRWPSGPVITPAASMADFPFQCCRIPMPSESGPLLENVVALLNAFQDAIRGHMTLVVQCRSGGLHSRSAFAVALFRIVSHIQLHRSVDPSLIKGGFPSTDIHGIFIVELVRAAPHGSTAWTLTTALNGDQSSPESLAKLKSFPRRYAVGLARLFNLVMVASFLLDQINQIDKESLSLGTTLETWLALHPELRRMFEALHKNYSTAERLAAAIPAGLSQEQQGLNGPEHILKDSHFQGCHQLHHVEWQLPGAPNFRIKRWRNRLIVGTGIPTLNSRLAIASAIRSAVGTESPLPIKLLWINMREEPVLFLGSQSFNLVLAKRPFENIVTTGIQAVDVERIEEELVAACRRDLEEHNELLVYGDVEDDDSGYALRPYRMSLGGPEEARTPAQAYLLPLPGINKILYHRIPISDEHAPLPYIFDLMFDLLLSFYLDSDDRSHSVSLFHCQMGRGRTTTGMILCAMVLDHLERRDGKRPQSPDAGVDNRLQSQSDDVLKDSIVGALAAVLPHGVAARQVVDATIDAFADIQNLREAIPTIKDPHHRSAYLERYFYLVAFAHFLFFDFTTCRNFQGWLIDRPHVVTLARRGWIGGHNGGGGGGGI